MSMIETLSDEKNSFLSRREIICDFKGLGGKLKKLEAVEMEKNQLIKDGIFYFNNERFWECHEALEGAWKQCTGDEKELSQGLILVAAALVHYQKDENTICLSVLGRALKKLHSKSGEYYKINVDMVKQKTIEILDKKEIFTFTF